MLKQKIKSILPNPALQIIRAIRSVPGSYAWWRSRPAGGPTFLVIGGVKCGTYSLYEYFKLHPDVVTGARKEIGYFNNDQIYPNHQWYESQFRIFDRRKLSQIQAVGEFTPSYCFSPCIERIYDYYPRMKLIMMVRNPVDRAISQYHMYIQKSALTGESRDLQTAIFADDGEMPHVSHAYLTRGRYHEQLDLICRYFPHGQIRIFRLEDLAADPARIMRELTDFLEIPPFRHIHFKPHNIGSYAPANPEICKALSNYFAPHNAILHKRFGIQIDDWNEKY